MTIGHPFACAPYIAIARRSLGRSFAVLALLSLGQAANAQTVLPTNADRSCEVSEQEFNGWFKSGSVSSNGKVVSANSLAFKADSLCAFYKWSEQMFLWLTSPEGSGHVFASPTFYAVSPADGNKRTLTPFKPGDVVNFTTHISQRGSRGQEVAFDSKGQVRDVLRPNGRLLTLNKIGEQVEIGRVQAAPDKKPLLFDNADKPIDLKFSKSGAPALRDSSGQRISAQAATVSVNGEPFLLTSSGGIVETEQGQAGGSVLMAQNESLVYYLLQVNNVLAYFKTGVQNAKISPQTQFPITQDLLDKITTVAQQAPAPHTLPPNTQLPDGTALTMEVKSSWVETDKLANAGDYLAIDATVPEFTKTDTKWTPTGSGRKTRLALVGMHVVGTVAGHPEMIWATFEHVNNAPNVPYTYNVAKQPVAGPPDGPGPWLFSKTGLASGNITRRMAAETAHPENIVAAPNQTIGPTDVFRKNPWGTAPADPNFASNNTDIISINNSVIGRLMAGDVRKKYMLVGAVWTFKGKPPSSNPNNHAGTKGLANATMETFIQNGNCLGCHKGDMLGTAPGPDGFTGGLSHIWNPIQPLFPK